MSTLEHDVTVPGELAEQVRKQEKELERLREQLRLWEEEFGANPAREALFSTSSGIDVEPLYTPADRMSEQAYTEALGAATAIFAHTKLVTRNVRDFEHIEELDILAI